LLILSDKIFQTQLLDLLLNKKKYIKYITNKHLK